MMRAYTERGVVLGDDHLRVLGREGLGHQGRDLVAHLRLIVDQLVKALGRPSGGLCEVRIVNVVAQMAQTFDDLFVAFLEERERFGGEVHGVSLYFA